MRFNRLLWPAVMLAAAGLGCSSPQSYIVLLLASSATPIANIAQLTVVVSQGTTEMQTLTYPADHLVVVNDSDAGVGEGTLSVSFSGTQTGDIKFEVTALDIRGCAIGNGRALISIIKGGDQRGDRLPHARAALRRRCGRARSAVRRRVPRLRSDRTLLSGDAILPGRLPDAVERLCHGREQRRRRHLPGYDRLHRRLAVLRLRLARVRWHPALPSICATDADCAALGDGGVGPGSYCRDPIACGGAFRTCTFSCDPTAAAAGASGSPARTGCPAGLACVIPSSMDHVDCSCPETTRRGEENAPCTSTAQCAPGFLCEQTCRAVCRCDAQSGVCTAPNDCPTTGTTCTVVPKQTIYGVCL